MDLVCLDLEGVLVPEIWIALAHAQGIEELRLTTRDIPDYDKLMKQRIAILDRAGLGIKDICKTIERMEPLEGALPFLNRLRERAQVIILSDTFSEFSLPLMKKLGMPTIFCNSLEISPEGRIRGYRLRQENGKYHAVVAFRSLGYRITAAGDSFNDLDMIRAADSGILFRAPAHIREANPNIPSCSSYEELYSLIESSFV